MLNKIKKRLFILLVVFVLSIVFAIIARLMGYLVHPSFAVKEEFNYKDTNITQTFDIDLSREGTYLIGLYTGQYYNLMKEKNDGNYTIEYYHEGKLLRTYQVEKWSEWLYRENDIVPLEGWNSVEAIAIEEFEIPKDIKSKQFTIKITTHKPYSMFTRNGLDEDMKIYLFLLRRSQKDLRRQEKTIQSIIEINKFHNDIGNSDITEIYDTNTSKIPFLKALLSKDFETVKSIIEADNGIGVNTVVGGQKKYRRSNNRTPIFYSAFVNDAKTLKYLIENGADLNHTDLYKQNALAHAIENASLETIKILFDAGMKISDVDYVNRYLAKEPHDRGIHQAPLVYAVSIGSYELTKLLLEHNATNRFPSVMSNGMDAYQYIYRIDNYKEMLTLLLDFNVSDFRGILPTKKELKTLYNGCIIGAYLDCGPITKKLRFEDLDWYVYFEQKHYSNKMDAKRKAKYEQEKLKTKREEK